MLDWFKKNKTTLPVNMLSDIDFIKVWFYHYDAKTETIIISNESELSLIDLEVEISDDIFFYLKTVIKELNPMSTYEIHLRKNQFFQPIVLLSDLALVLKSEETVRSYKQKGNNLIRIQ